MKTNTSLCKTEVPAATPCLLSRPPVSLDIYVLGSVPTSWEQYDCWAAWWDPNHSSLTETISRWVLNYAIAFRIGSQIQKLLSQLIGLLQASSENSMQSLLPFLVFGNVFCCQKPKMPDRDLVKPLMQSKGFPPF